MRKLGLTLHLIAMLCGGYVWSHVYIYAPGFGYSRSDQAVNEAAMAARNLHIFSHDEQLYTCIEEHAGVGRIRNADNTNFVYVVLFSDFHVGDRGMYLGQGRDVAELLYTHCYVASQCNQPIHFIGHSRGSATIVTYLGLLGSDFSKLRKLVTDFLSHEQLRHAGEWHPESITCKDLIPRIGAVCVCGTFDNFEDVIRNIATQQGLPRWLARRLVKYPRYYSKWAQYLFTGLDYACNTDTPPIAMVQYIPAHIPCIFVHAEHDPLIPSSNSRDLYRIRKHVQSATDVWCCDVGASHVAIPYQIDMPEIGDQLHTYCRQMCQ